ncbi:hypothetical protein BGY98DRAFT_1093809 [Russula aff. rugulosa BPL654]|nr:hypothetical protein BGY98DRAFT_1093809 [Russula aff. rugulosa BPL654]
MRRYHIVFEMLLILSIIDFTLAAPVLVQEKRQLYVDVVQIPKDVRTLLKKRVGEDDLAKLAEEYLETGGKPIESSDTHAPSGSAPQGPDHGPTTNVAQAPLPNLAPSTSNPDSLMKPPSQSWEASMPGGTFKEPWNYGYSSQGGHWHNPLDPMSIPGSPGHGSDNKWTWNNEYLSQDDHWHNPLDPMSIPGSPGHGSDNKWTWAKAPKSNPNPNPMPSTEPDPNFDWDHWRNVESPPRQTATWSNVPKSKPIWIPKPSADADPDFDWKYWMTMESPPRQKPAPRPAMPKPGPLNPSLSTELDSDRNLMAANRPQSSQSQSSTEVFTIVLLTTTDKDLPYSDAGSPNEPASPDADWRKLPEGGMLVGPPPSPAATDDPDLQFDHQSSSTAPGVQPVVLDAQDLAYTLKGKGKVLRRVSSTARDVGNAAEERVAAAC